MSNFQPRKVVGRRSDTRFYLGEIWIRWKKIHNYLDLIACEFNKN